MGNGKARCPPYLAAGNIVKEPTLPKPDSVSLPPVTMTYSAANRLATYNEQAVQFDADGNLLVGPLAGGMANFSFDSRNRLVAAGETSYRYDAENQRVGVNQTNYVVNSQPALSQVLVKEENRVKTFYVYGLGLLGEEKDGEYRSYHFDFRGSTVAITDQTGKVVERFQYGPYGELLKGEAAVTPFLFNGKFGVMTEGNGLYYMRARFYSAVIKRFVNMDVLLGSVGDGQTLNRYGYTENNPIVRIDPEGKLWWWLPAIYATLFLTYDTRQEHMPKSHALNPETTHFVNKAIELIRSSGYVAYADGLTIMLQNGQIREYSPTSPGELGLYDYNEIYISDAISGGFSDYASILVHECAHKEDFSTGNTGGKNVLYILQVLTTKYEDRSAEKYAFETQHNFEQDYKAWLKKNLREQNQ